MSSAAAAGREDGRPGQPPFIPLLRILALVTLTIWHVVATHVRPTYSPRDRARIRRRVASAAQASSMPARPILLSGQAATPAARELPRASATPRVYVREGSGRRPVASWLPVVGIAAILALVVWRVTVTGMRADAMTITWIYTVIVVTYLLSRFAMIAFYHPPKDVGYKPRVAVIVPAYNEGASVTTTIDAIMATTYPRHLLEVICINDGSSDDTWEHMQRAAAAYPRGAVRCLDLGENRGKREAMAEGIRQTEAEVLLFLDSDCAPAVDGIRLLVQGLADPKVGAVAGLTYARNAETNLLTRMQAARYYVSFQLLKAAESVVGAVSCCSGCFAAYRREAVEPVLQKWEQQDFLGVRCTYGDDRALTNMLIRNGWHTIYHSQAEAWTDVPDRYGKFFRQQSRWKKSWAREGPLLLVHLWRTRPLAFPAALIGALASILAPWIVLINLASPLISGAPPTTYLLGLYLVAVLYGLLYRAFRNDGLWPFALLGTVFYLAFSMQLWWAIVRLRDTSWGTRKAVAS